MDKILKKHKAIKILEDLVAIKSVNPFFDNESSGENGIVEYIEQLLKGTGLGLIRQNVFPGRDNLIIELRTGNARHTIVFDAHLDTVGAGSMKDAFMPLIKDGRLYGRGACDTKGSLAGMLYAIMQCAKTSKSLSADILLLASVDEEHKYMGLRSFIGSNIPVSAAVVGEPTDLRIVTAHKGVVRFSVTTKGTAAHSSVPDEGDSAILQMMHVVQLIQNEIEPELRQKYHPLCGRPTISIGKITGGSQVNIVPDKCEIEVDRRIIPGEDPETVFSRFKENLASYISKKQVNLKVDEMLLTWPFETDENDPVVMYSKRSAEKCLLSPVLMGVPFGSDASKLQRAGIPSVVFGPGSIDQAHSSNEWVDIDQVVKASEFYLELMKTYGGK